MVRRISVSQFNSLMRQQQQKQRQLQQRQKQAVDKVKRDLERAHRELKVQERKRIQAVEKYNREARAHNARVRANQQRLRVELAKLKQRTTPAHLATLRVSIDVVQSSYSRLEKSASAGELGDSYNDVLDLSEKEAANSASVANALVGDARPMSDDAPDSPDSPLTQTLEAISTELAKRWKGALYALNPQNPDAARHFCTSAREIISQILDVKAPDVDVVAALPSCELTPEKKTPTRRAKIQYVLLRSGKTESELEEFLDADMKNVVDLFQIFNKATHGEAGAYSYAQLRVVRERVEDALIFLSRFVNW